ncbi:MAG: alpha amylase family protein [Alistipes sp.]
MKKLLLCCFAALAVVSCTTVKQEKPLYMWFDCEANYARLSHPDSIRYYVTKLHDMGFTDLVIDVKSIMGETLYKSDIAPYMGEWEGVTRPANYDILALFIEEGHKQGLRVHGSLNVFAGGHNYFDRGIIYGEHADWQSQVYTEGKIVPISTIKSNYNGMLNPANPEVQEYELAILREFATKYPTVDGIIFDRVRFDNITSDFSLLSKELFEKYAGVSVRNFPDDILYWEQGADQKWNWKPGALFNKWVEWRASVIKNFVVKAHTQLKQANPKLLIGDYTGAWYPTYYYVGVNWASDQFDPSQDFDWATPEYKNTGYAEQLDIYMTGLYYTLVTKDEVDKANNLVGQRTEAGMVNEQNYWYCIEGGAEWAKKITKGVVPVTGSIYVEQYEGNATQFSRAVAQALRDTDGLMIFDIDHIIKRDWWSVLSEGIHDGSNTENN